MDNEETLARLRQRKDLLERLLSSPEWDMLQGQIEATIRAKKSTTFSLTLGSLDAAFTLARNQGEIEGLFLALHIPEFMLNEVKAELDALLAELREKEQ